jgi:hypothetical protein
VLEDAAAAVVVSFVFDADELLGVGQIQPGAGFHRRLGGRLNERQESTEPAHAPSPRPGRDQAL